MGELRDRMEASLALKAYAAPTRAEYVRCIRQLAAFYRRSPAELNAEDLRRYLIHLIDELAYSPSNLKMHVAAVKFLYTVTLDKPELVARIPYPKVPKPLLDIPTADEIATVLGAVRSPKIRVLLFCAYAAGLRVAEACRLCVGDIDSTRMVIHVRAGKGGRDRFATLSPALLDALRQYFREHHPPRPFLFPGAIAGQPVRPESVQTALRMALEQSGVPKRVTPHMLRHAYATHALESGTDVRILQVLLGHAHIRTTTRYAHVSTKLVAAARSPFDAIAAQIRATAAAHGKQKAPPRPRRPRR